MYKPFVPSRDVRFGSVTTGRTQVEHIESALPPNSRYAADIPDWLLSADCVEEIRERAFEGATLRWARRCSIAPRRAGALMVGISFASLRRF
jgi:hypothetical protein